MESQKIVKPAEVEFFVIMVSFICNVCGQTVRKAQVERHYQNDCRNCEVLSCIDCGRDFHGDEYTSHTSCITEAEKYQGKLYKPKDRQNKGEHKQQEWLKVIKRMRVFTLSVVNSNGDSIQWKLCRLWLELHVSIEVSLMWIFSPLTSDIWF